jgi:hypothetical protein
VFYLGLGADRRRFVVEVRRVCAAKGEAGGNFDEDGQFSCKCLAMDP